MSVSLKVSGLSSSFCNSRKSFLILSITETRLFDMLRVLVSAEKVLVNQCGDIMQQYNNNLVRVALSMKVELGLNFNISFVLCIMFISIHLLLWNAHRPLKVYSSREIFYELLTITSDHLFIEHPIQIWICQRNFSA